jgi:cytochrome bd-type quinol oxidase subunit 2
MNSIGPLWDGNEVWLVTFDGALFAACGMPFVLAYTSVVYWVFRGKVQLGKFSY